VRIYVSKTIDTLKVTYLSVKDIKDLPRCAYMYKFKNICCCCCYCLSHVVQYTVKETVLFYYRYCIKPAKKNEHRGER